MLRRERPFKGVPFPSCPPKLTPQDLLRAPCTATHSRAVEFTPQPQQHGDSHWGPEDSESSGISLPGASGTLETTQLSPLTLPGSRAGAVHGT